MSSDASIFLNEYPTKFMLYIYENEGDNLCKRDVSTAVGTTYAHGIKVIERLVDSNLLTTERKGRKDVLTLTDRGVEKAKNLKKLVDLSGGFDE